MLHRALVVKNLFNLGQIRFVYVTGKSQRDHVVSVVRSAATIPLNVEADLLRGKYMNKADPMLYQMHCQLI